MKFGKLDEVFKAYSAGQCDTFTADISQLYALRLNLEKPGDHIILPDVISKEPLGARGAPARRRLDHDREVDALCDDQRRRTRHYLEEHRRGAEVEEARRDRLVGPQGLRRGARPPQRLGRAPSATSAITAKSSNESRPNPRCIPRGLNQLWNAGGIQYAPPIR